MKAKTAKPAPRKVLIIEDEGDLCLLLNILLDEKGMEVDHVQSLAKAEEYLLQDEPTLILLDNRLPDGFGVDFLPFIKKGTSICQGDYDFWCRCRCQGCGH